MMNTTIKERVIFMRKISLLLLSLVISITLVGCGQQANSSSQKSSSSTSAKSNSKHSTSHETYTLKGDNAYPVVSKTWKFNQFKIISLNAENNKGKLDLEINWENTSQQAASFNNLVQVTVKQNGKTVNISENDDEASGPLDAKADDDVDFKYQLPSKTGPVTVTISPAHTTTGKSVTLNLK
ncbi:hypothetical protein ABTQ33_03140 [Paucilactobacillus suebicus]|uniref:DUF5067 domain-containing protein n=2 Tax=Paucilactobacillus suebicus TaxID=152335 RepID=A0A0R1WBN6_9LACO|nr:hypothetical protein FD16_GL000887 [Paucilactobacillus suebicus DSM 5007 = KCTC 3549]